MMDKKTYNLSDEEEYQFQEPESATSFSTSSPAAESSSVFERINRQHIVFGFIFIFLVFGAYKLISGLFHVIAKQQAIVKVQKAAPKINPVNNDVDVKTEVSRRRLDHLAQAQSDVKSAIQALDLQLSSIQTSLANLNNQLSQVNDEVQSLHAGQETLIQNQTKPVKKLTEKKKESPKAIYYVRALIPNRVWLTTPEGSTLTLAVGDKLDGYGVIDSINADQGIVTFSSGAVIGYSPDDR
jgi:hypothetical protein